MAGDKTGYEDDGFWEEVMPILFTPERLEASVLEVDEILELTGLEPPLDVLDLCCGVGRHSLELARRGFRVIGVDRTQRYLDRAKETAGKGNLNVTLIQQDMRQYRHPDSFDLVLNLFTSFGYFEDPEDDLRVMKNISDSLRTGGMFVLQTIGKEILARKFRERDWHRLEDGSLMLEERMVTNDWTWMQNRWILIRDGTLRELDLSHRLYSAKELADLAKDCGFREVESFGGFNGSPYDIKAKRLVMVARK